MPNKIFKSILNNRLLVDIQNPSYDSQFVHSVEVVDLNKVIVKTKVHYQDYELQMPPEEEWQDMFESEYDIGTTFNYHNMNVSLPDTDEPAAMSDINDLSKTSVSIKNKYNYFSDYVDLISFPEDEMNNISYYHSFPHPVNRGRIQKLLPLTIPSTSLLEFIFKDFEDFVDEYKIKDQGMMNHMREIFFEDNVSFPNLHSHKDLFPFYNELKIRMAPLTERTEFRNYLHDKHNGENILAKMSLALRSNSGASSVSSFLVDGSVTNVVNQSLENIINNYAEESDRMILLAGDAYSNWDEFNHEFNVWDKTLFLAGVEDNFKKYGQKLSNIISDSPSKFETLFYKIDKFDGDFRIQTFYVPAHNINYLIDTQIKLNKTYNYRFTAYILSYGTECSFEVGTVSPIKLRESGKGAFVEWQTPLRLNTRPDLRVFEVVLGEYESNNSEPLPAVPNISFVNTSNNTNFVKLIFEQSKNTSSGEFVAFSTDEFGLGAVGKSTFHYNHILPGVELYRLSKRPYYYRTFNNNLMAEVSNEFSRDYIEFHDHLQPEKKYYYMARSMNNTGFVSNPSPVYEVYLTKASGKSVIHVKLLRMKKEKTKQRSMLFNKFLQIRPSENQSFLNTEDELLDGSYPYSEVFDDIVLGDGTQESLFDRKFKFRIRSKQTGRFIDFDIKFKLDKNKKPE